jgi:hypothetical protein
MFAYVRIQTMWVAASQGPTHVHSPQQLQWQNKDKCDEPAKHMRRLLSLEIKDCSQQ